MAGPILVSYREGIRDINSRGSVSGVNLAQVLICGYSIYSNHDMYIFHVKHYDPCDLPQYQEDSRTEVAVLYHPWGDEPIPKPGSLCWGIQVLGSAVQHIETRIPQPGLQELRH